MSPEAREILKALVDRPGTSLGLVLGFIVGLVVVFGGWARGLSFVLCVGVGLLVGRWVDGKGSLREFIERMLPPGER